MRVVGTSVIIYDLIVPQTVYEKLEQAANRDSRPLEHIINVALAQYVERRQKP